MQVGVTQALALVHQLGAGEQDAPALHRRAPSASDQLEQIVFLIVHLVSRH